MPPWMKRRIEHARARCEKSLPSHKQKTERKAEEKQSRKQTAKASNNSR